MATNIKYYSSTKGPRLFALTILVDNDGEIQTTLVNAFGRREAKAKLLKLSGWKGKELKALVDQGDGTYQIDEVTNIKTLKS
jgi:hypothetical protein